MVIQLGYDYYLKKIKESFEKQNNENKYDRAIRDSFLENWGQLRQLSQLNEDKNVKVYNPAKIKLGEQIKLKKTLIFDLDETLIHCEKDSKQQSDYVLNTSIDGRSIQLKVNVRPYVKEMLAQLSNHFEIIIFTASREDYANQIIDLLDPEKQFIYHRLYRNHCKLIQNTYYIKDLSIIQNRDIQNIILIDNSCYSFGNQLDNCIPIIPFINDPNDKELKQLTSFLMSLNLSSIKSINLRIILNPIFKLQELQNQEEVTKAFSTLIYS